MNTFLILTSFFLVFLLGVAGAIMLSIGELRESKEVYDARTFLNPLYPIQKYFHSKTGVWCNCKAGSLSVLEVLEGNEKTETLVCRTVDFEGTTTIEPPTCSVNQILVFDVNKGVFV